MKGLFAVMMVALVVSSCRPADTQPANEYQRSSDQWIARLGLERIGIWPCKTDDAFDECYKLQPTQRWHGIWVLGPGEHDEQFCPNSVCSPVEEPAYILNWKPGVLKGHAIDTSGLKRYAVDFVGRRSIYRHEMDPVGDPYVIVVDRLNSISKVPETTSRK